MSSISAVDGNRRPRRAVLLSMMTEVLESRALLADGITPAGVSPLTAVVDVPLTNAIFATYTVSDPSGEPGTQWRALINFGDGHIDGPVIPVEKGSEFEFVDTHTYTAPGVYTVTIMIAVPGSHQPNDDTVTTKVTVTTSSPISNPPPTPPPPPPPHLSASSVKLKARVNKTFHGQVAGFKEPGTKAREFQATIDWGDNSLPTIGQIRARGAGRFQVVGFHRYAERGVFHIAVRIAEADGETVVTNSTARVIR